MFSRLNNELNPNCHLLAILGAHHILHVGRIRVKGHFNPSNDELNHICHLLVLLGAHHILHVGRIRVKRHFKGHFNTSNNELNPICHLLALLEFHHILHVSRIRFNVYFILNKIKRYIIEIQKLRVFEWKILGRIFGPTKKNQIWRIKTNEE
jgi:hypothetical protein